MKMSELSEKISQSIGILNEETRADFDFHKPAIRWKVPDCCSQQEGGEYNEYWNFPLECSELDASNRIISYSELLIKIRQIVHELRKIHSDITQQSSSPFAVSIPEGPFLPLAILSIFMLNVSATHNKAPIILPLDPDEGKDRLVHMLLDAKPSVILYVSQKDKEKLDTACAMVKEKYSAFAPAMVNIKSLLHIVEGESRVSKSLQGSNTFLNRVSHIVYTSGTTGQPKGCKSSISALYHYIKVKNKYHEITAKSKVFLASALPFDPCLSDIIATFFANATLCICPREAMKANLTSMLVQLESTHILCTPSLWASVGSESRNELGCLEVVALGGEIMSARIKNWWARRGKSEGKIKLLSTYGVTEACVYQTIGEIFADAEVQNKGQDIGVCFDGLEVRICQENCKDNTSTTFFLQEVEKQGNEGEIIIEGKQLDEFSGYLNMTEATNLKFVPKPGFEGRFCYRTGDRGYIDPTTSHLHILGRIGGEEGMVKINGVRVELGEIEHSILDSAEFLCKSPLHLVMGCVVKIDTVDDDETKKLTAYCAISDQCLREIGVLSFPNNALGIICPPSPLLTALRARCKEKVRKGSTPSTFVIIERIPLTRTGKIDREAFPALENCVTLHEVAPGYESSTHLSNYGRCGPFITNELIKCLNLHSSQKEMITTSATFALLGGDSLAATRIVRALYASHHGLRNNRFLGGIYGQLEGAAFNASQLVRANSLGEYIDFLDSCGVLLNVDIDESCVSKLIENQTEEGSNDDSSALFDALMRAITLDQSTIAVALLAEGADPNLKNHGGRLGKTSGRFKQRDTFKSNPMHIACAKADVDVVRALLKIGKCTCKSPDSSGSYPIHLACSGLGDGIGPGSKKYDAGEDSRRLKCVQLLLDEGKVPLSMKNSSKQTVLHCAARGGYLILLDYLLDRWKRDESIKKGKQWGGKCDWQDHWFRTPVHWAVLHGNISALDILLKHGCSPRPPKPKLKSAKRTSGEVESPDEICARLYKDDEVGNEILDLLANYSK